MANVVETLVDHHVFSHYNRSDGLATALDRTAARVSAFYGARGEAKPLLPQTENVYIPFMHELKRAPQK